MSETVAFLLDGKEVLTYDRSIALPEEQKQFLDDMDRDMDEGILLSHDSVEKPDLQQKAQFVALSLVNALLKEEDKLAVILFTYLVARIPDLKQVKGKLMNTDGEGENDKLDINNIGVEFIFDEIKPQGQVMQFQPNPKLKKSQMH